MGYFFKQSVEVCSLYPSLCSVTLFLEYVNIHPESEANALEGNLYAYGPVDKYSKVGSYKR